MVDVIEAIPVTGIYLTDVFDRVYRGMCPHSREIEVRLINPGTCEDWDQYDHAQRCANERVRNAIADQSLTPLIYVDGISLKLPHEGWEIIGQFATGIGSNFVRPNDPINPGPRTDVDGKPHAVFMDRTEFDGWFNTIFPAQVRLAEEVVPETRRGGKKKGDGSYDPLDQPLLEEITTLLRENKAASVQEAARMVAPMAHGAGTPDSKATRLRRAYKKFRARQIPIAP
jgi:hypothetical protein